MTYADATNSSTPETTHRISRWGAFWRATLTALGLCILVLAGCAAPEQNAAEESTETPAAEPAAYGSAADEGAADEASADESAEDLAASDYSLAYCSVRMNAPEDPCGPVRGKRASGVAPGCSHDNCTAAKANARANLLTGIPAACGAYIDCGPPCRCIQKNELDALLAEEEAAAEESSE